MTLREELDAKLADGYACAALDYYKAGDLIPADEVRTACPNCGESFVGAGMVDDYIALTRQARELWEAAEKVLDGAGDDIPDFGFGASPIRAPLEAAVEALRERMER